LQAEEGIYGNQYKPKYDQKEAHPQSTTGDVSGKETTGKIWGTGRRGEIRGFNMILPKHGVKGPELLGSAGSGTVSTRRNECRTSRKRPGKSIGGE